MIVAEDCCRKEEKMDMANKSERKKLVKRLPINMNENCSLYLDESNDPLGNAACMLFFDHCFPLLKETCTHDLGRCICFG